MKWGYYKNLREISAVEGDHWIRIFVQTIILYSRLGCLASVWRKILKWARSKEIYVKVKPSSIWQLHMDVLLCPALAVVLIHPAIIKNVCGRFWQNVHFRIYPLGTLLYLFKFYVYIKLLSYWNRIIFLKFSTTYGRCW